MRKPRDIDSELQALEAKAKVLKERRVRQLGELVIATKADMLDADVLAGALIEAATTDDANVKGGWRKEGAAFFRSKARKNTRGAGRGIRDSAAAAGDAQPAAGEARAS